MDHVTLGTSDLKVSRLCLGAMNWGNRNTEAFGHGQLDRCLDAGVNFVDTAEMYPVSPIRPETVGHSEEIIGRWCAKTGRRADLVIATKVSGPNGGWVREGRGYDGAVVTEAIDASLRRLQTDVIDLYQLHWPVRGSYHFRQNWAYDPSEQDTGAVRAHMLEVLAAMDAAVRAGKVRAFGLSNETTWGTAQWIRLAEENGLPRVVSMQNEYSLMCRLADTDMAELCHHEQVGMLPFTPMVAGMLSESHGAAHFPEASRRAVDGTVGGRVTERVWPAAEAYRAVAAKHGLDVNQMALAWTLTRPFVASSIFGATTEAQLELALPAGEMTLSQDCLDDLSAVHKAHPLVF